MPPPRDFTDLAKAYNAPINTLVSVIGAVVDLMAPAATRSGEWMMTFKLLDPKLRDSLYGSQGVTLRFFKKDYLSLPRVQNVGDIVLVRNVKVTAFSQQPMLLGNFQTTVVVFPAATIPDPSFQIAYQGSKRLECLGVPIDTNRVTLDEQSYAIALKHDVKDVVDSLPSNSVFGFDSTAAPPNAPSEPAAKRIRLSEPMPSAQPPPNAPTGQAAGRTHQSNEIPLPARPPRPSSFGHKFKLVKDLQHYDFADVCVQVVKKYPLQFGGCELYVTDYTPNEAMWFYPPPEDASGGSRDGDEFGYAGSLSKRQFPGPYGFLVLKVTLVDPHANFANQKVSEGDFVLLQNVKMKQRDVARMVGDMWPDSRNPEKVQVNKLMNHGLPEINSLLLRKEKYWASRKAKADNPQADKAQNQKPSRAEKIAKRKLKKQQRKEKTAREVAKADCNQHVRCNHEEFPITSVKDILDPDNERHTNTVPGGTSYVLPFINAKYRARVRVVDYEPKQLEDFAVLEHPDDDDDKSASSIDMDWQATPKYRWAFNLLLEDASAPAQNKKNPDTTTTQHRLWASFDHESAQYLLGNAVEDPSDLRQDARLLGQLREKLCILWGDLEEKKDGEKPSNRPFECCIQEYGVEMDDGDAEKADRPFGYARMYGVFGVTIS